MLFVRDEDRELEIWRDGVSTRMCVSAAIGASQLTVFEQWCASGRGAPDHIHAVEEVLRVLDGVAEIWVESERQTVKSGESVIIPAGMRHGFDNVGAVPLHTLAILAEPIFEVHYIESGRSDRRWGPDQS
jgi:mannose-6-phosphate isomerase-like protein (cupin superfamily)